MNNDEKHAHVLDASSQTNINHARLDEGGNVCCGLEAAAALAVHGAQRDVVGQLSHELAHAGGQAAGTRLKNVADLDVSDVLGVHLGSVHDFPEHP